MTRDTCLPPVGVFLIPGISTHSKYLVCLGTIHRLSLLPSSGLPHKFLRSSPSKTCQHQHSQYLPSGTFTHGNRSLKRVLQALQTPGSIALTKYLRRFHFWHTTLS
jgi:hypothetical protein